jgi:hypothetical protein
VKIQKVSNSFEVICVFKKCSEMNKKKGLESSYFVLKNTMKSQFKLSRLSSAAIIFLLLSCFSLPALAQQTNPNRLPPCPKPDYSKNTDLERFAKWTNCWGKYRFELSSKTKGDVIESEWRDGKANGYGSYIFFSGEKYIGDFKNDKFDGNGVYIFTDGSKYLGDFKEDKRQGKGKFLAVIGDSYEGEYSNDKEHGRGTYTFADGSKYIGDFFEGKKHGQGTITFQDGEKYSGSFENGYFNGRGTYNHKNGDKYVGEYRNGNKHGQGIFSFANGSKYVGQWVAGLFQGWGTFSHASGDKYTGEFKDGNYHGRGLYLSADGRRKEGIFENGNFINAEKIDTSNLTDNFISSINRLDTPEQINPNKLPLCPTPDYSKKRDDERVSRWTKCWGKYTVENRVDKKGDTQEGEWDNGNLNGYGIYTHASRNKYVGNFQDGLKHGKGKYLYVDGGTYAGDWLNDKQNGQGTYIHANESMYVGDFKDAKPHGRGIYFTTSGEIFDGEFKDGKWEGQGILTFHDGSKIEGIWRNNEFIRKEKIKLSVISFGIASTEKLAIENGRRRVEEYRKRLQVDQQPKTQEINNQLNNLQVSHTQVDEDGSIFLNIQTNKDTSSLKINGIEHGRRPDGNYLIKKIVRVGQETKFIIIATDINGNSSTKTVTVNRLITESKPFVAVLNPAQVKKQPERDAVAVIIGISSYKSLPRADFAKDDAQVFYDYAIRALGVKPENIKLLLDAEAEEVEIFKAFKTWLPSRVKSTTDVYVFYSGHGLPTSDGLGLYLLPYRADRDLISKTAVQFQEINMDIQAAKPKSVTIFMDACYSGQARGGETLIESARPLALKAQTSIFPSSFTVFSASQSDQISSSSPDLQHGIFSYYLMRGMEGDADTNKDGKITLGEMQAYLSENVARQAAMMSRKQEPQLIGDANRVLVGR